MDGAVVIWLVVAAAFVVGVLVGYFWGFGQGDMDARIQADDLITRAEQAWRSR